ncbi:MAG TPA: hypothetical protein VKV21_17365 [Solirubrobacteraceae bacterium]|nr:hypothetical protein [Solirubrobacteraceae bacterium]
MSRRRSLIGAIGVTGLVIAALSGCGAARRPTAASATTRTTARTGPSTSASTGAASATSSSGQTTTTRTTQTARRPRDPSHPVVSHLGTPGRRWRAVVTVRGRTAAWVAERDGVTMLRFNQRVARLVLHAGSVDPGGGGWRYGDAIVGAERRRLIAAFNAGFKLDTGAGGWRSGNRTAVPLMRGRASIVTYRNGFTDIGAWGQGVPSRQPIASVRQNLYLLVSHGVAASSVGCIETCWGATVGGVLSVARSALGIDAHGRLIYGAAASATPATLAQGLIDGGVRRAAELDINPDWVAAYLYRHPRRGPPRYVPVIPGQYGVYGQFLLPYSRDFFAVIAR